MGREEVGREPEKGIPVAMCPIPYLSYLELSTGVTFPKTAWDFVTLAKIHHDCMSFVAYRAIQSATPTADVYALDCDPGCSSKYSADWSDNPLWPKTRMCV